MLAGATEQQLAWTSLLKMCALWSVYIRSKSKTVSQKLHGRTVLYMFSFSHYWTIYNRNITRRVKFVVNLADCAKKLGLAYIRGGVQYSHKPKTKNTSVILLKSCYPYTVPSCTIRKWAFPKITSISWTTQPAPDSVEVYVLSCVKKSYSQSRVQHSERQDQDKRFTVRLMV